ELEHATDLAPAGSLHERRELVERIFGVESGTREIQSDEIRTLGRCRRVDQPTSPSNAYSAGPESSNVSGPARTTSSPPGTRTRTAASMRRSQAAAATVADAPFPHDSPSEPSALCSVTGQRRPSGAPMTRIPSAPTPLRRSQIC